MLNEPIIYFLEQNRIRVLPYNGRGPLQPLSWACKWKTPLLSALPVLKPYGIVRQHLPALAPNSLSASVTDTSAPLLSIIPPRNADPSMTTVPSAAKLVPHGTAAAPALAVNSLLTIAVPLAEPPSALLPPLQPSNERQTSV
jgi:hypothetical protein